ncbi:Brix domain containing protein [Trichuris trichiura]|uniref:Ribosome production factor 2 homolog n=1 Tax=Trichuris trichiura TaxID=36087 RepID=A0A077YXV7_TRITR|nr:Brix domain containing protein [Trichuris trichiura]
MDEVKSVDASSLIRKPKTQAGKRHLEKRLPKLVENDKTTIFIRGSKTSKTMEQCMDNLVQLKKPNEVRLRRKNEFLPFVDETPFEKFCMKYDASLFCFISNSKKRPNNLVLGRMYDFNVLDMFEFGVENFASIYDFKNCRIPLGVKPCLLFMGDEFESDPVFVRMKSLLIDFFRGPVITKLRLQGIEYALMFTAVDGKVLVRAYSIHLKESSTTVPDVHLEPAGPSMDLIVRRNKIASDSLYKTACKVPSAVKPKKMKNTEQDVFGTTRGRIHVKQQPLDTLKLSKLKGLKARIKKKNT